MNNLIDMPSQVTEQDKLNIEAKIYLASTDWYVIRALEDPTKPVPADIVAARQAARDGIV